MYQHFRVTRSFVLIILLLVANTLVVKPQKLVYLIPPAGLESEQLYDLEHPFRDRDDCLRYLVELRRALVKNGYEVVIGNLKMHFKHGSAIITSNIPSSMDVLGNLKKSNPKVLLAILTEPPSVLPINYDRKYTRYFDALLTMEDKAVDNKKYFKLHFPHPSLKLTSKFTPFSKKKFCTMIVGNKTSSHSHELYSARRETISFFNYHYPHEFDLYGKGWSKSEFAIYKGGVANKVDVLPDYKFCICYENISSMRGYVTEKILDALVNKCVPIYWGAPNIADYVPEDCFIDRRKFPSHKALYAYLKNMSEATYNSYLAAAERFLQTRKAYKFSLAHFNKSVLAILNKKFQ